MTSTGGFSAGGAHQNRVDGPLAVVLTTLIAYASIPLREKLIKIEANVIWHAKYVTLQMDDVAVSRELLAAILERT